MVSLTVTIPIGNSCFCYKNWYFYYHHPFVDPLGSAAAASCNSQTTENCCSQVGVGACDPPGVLGSLSEPAILGLGPHVWVVRKWREYGFLHFGLNDNTGAFMIFPHFASRHVGQLPRNYTINDELHIFAEHTINL